MDAPHHLHIGMRKVKSLLAIIIGFLIWQVIRLFFPDLEVHPLFIYLYGILEIRDTSEKTKTLSIQRLKANGVAFVFALLLIPLRIYMYSRLESTLLLTFLDLMMILVGSLVTLQLAERLRCGAMTGLAAVYYIILLIYHAGNDRYLYVFLRASQTVIGVAVAWLVNVVLFPYPSRKQKKETQEK